MNALKSTWVISLSFTIAIVVAGCSHANLAVPPSSPPPASQPQTQLAGSTVFPLAKVPKLVFPRYSKKQLNNMWPAFQHEPFEASGFSHLTLPFRYVSDVGAGNANEAYALSFLLSGSLDWVPGSYCSRHTYFVFKRERPRMQRLAREYDKNLIGFLVRDWSATHAIGGVLRKGKDGYSGTLEIYDRNGKLKFQQEYADPRSFFDLLGDMAVDAMKYFGHQPNPQLISHLHHKRCRNPLSLVELGQAAFAKERSAEEFGFYESILARDPDFSEVRYWAANQKYWSKGNREEYVYQLGLVMRSYLLEAAVWDFHPTECPDKELAKEYPRWLATAEEFLGPDSPSIAWIRLKQAGQSRNLPWEFLCRTTQIAGRYPNEYFFLMDLGQAWSYFNPSSCDGDMASSLFLAAMQNHYLPSEGKRDSFMEFCRVMAELGHDGIAIEIGRRLLRDEGNEGDRFSPFIAMIQARSLAKIGQYDEAIQAYQIAWKYHKADHSDKNQALIEMVIVATMGGRDEVVTEIRTKYSDLLSQIGADTLLDAYAKMAKGENVDAQAVYEKYKTADFWSYRRAIEFCAQVDLLAGKTRFRPLVIHLLRYIPNDRTFWILFDAYDRMKPQEKAKTFYDSLEWLHNDDPWVKIAVADRRSRSKTYTPPTSDDLLLQLADYQPVRWPEIPVDKDRAVNVIKNFYPGVVEASIHGLITQGCFDKAEELAFRYHALSVQRGNYMFRMHCNHLIHLVEQARMKPATQQAQ